MKGTNLKGNITATLADENGVFSINATSVTVAEAQSGNGKDITVTFEPTAARTYSGTVTLSSEEVQDVVVYLNGTPEGFDVTVSSYGLSTLYLDFPVQIPYDTYDPDLLGVYYAYNVDPTGKELKIYRLEDYIPANTGVIVQGNSGTYTFPYYAGTVNPIDGSLLTGTLENVSVSDVLAGHPGSIVMTLGMGPTYVGFYKYNGSQLGANKAFYIYEGNEAGGAKELTITIDDGKGGATGIKVIGNDTQNTDNRWYTPQGVLLNGKPDKHGIYIHNGKKVIIK